MAQTLHDPPQSRPPLNTSPTTSLPEAHHALPARVRLKIAKDEFQHMLDMGIVRPSSSPWASPLHMVPKPQPGDWRPCGEYSALNHATIPDQYPVPHLQDFYRPRPSLPPNPYG